MPSTLGAALRAARERLIQALGLDAQGAGLEAQMLLGQVLTRPRAHLLAHPEAALSDTNRTQFDGLLTRRERGEPIAYILQEREFFGLSLRITPAVLIPRPDTEQLVMLALALVPERTASAVLDLGTGSGAIAIAIAKQRPLAHVVAVEYAGDALLVARENARRHGATNIRFVQGDWFAPLVPGEHFDVIAANPPYIAAGDVHLAQGDLRFEPASALVSGAEGLDAIRIIARAAPPYLARGGWLLLEHGYEQGAACRQILADCGFQDISSYRDLAGWERITSARPCTAQT